MAYSAVTKPNVGDAVKAIEMRGVIDNQADFQSRLTTVEGSVGKIIVFDLEIVNTSDAASLSGVGVYRCPAAFSLTSAIVTLGDSTGLSLSGTLSFDLQKSSSRDFSASTSVFTTKPSLSSFTAFTESSNAVFKTDGTEDLSAGDYLKLDIDSLPSGDIIPRIHIHVFGE